MPCSRHTTGYLAPRHINAFHRIEVGKEAIRLTEREHHLSDEQPTSYADPRRDTWQRFALPVLKTIGPTTLARETKLATSTITELLAGRTGPHRTTQAKLERAAVWRATAELRQQGLPVPHNRLARLYAYIRSSPQPGEARVCPECGSPVGGPAQTYCSGACKQRAYRRRRDAAHSEKRTARPALV